MSELYGSCNGDGAEAVAATRAARNHLRVRPFRQLQRFNY